MRGPLSQASDHASFASVGIPALFLYRTDDPNYHTANDRSEFVDPNILGQAGTIVLDPTRGQLEDAQTQVSRRHKLELQLEGIADQPAVTPGGRPIVLMGNVDLPEEIEHAVRHGAQGVGLLRTEFLAQRTTRDCVPDPPSMRRRDTEGPSLWPRLITAS